MAGRRRKVEPKNYETLIKESEEKIVQLTNDLKAEKITLKKLKKDKEIYEIQKKEEEKMERTKKVAEMIAASGKSLEEIEAFLSVK